MSTKTETELDKRAKEVVKQIKEMPSNPFTQLTRMLGSAAIGYGVAAAISTNVSMTLTATAWASGWTYFWWALGMGTVWLVHLSFWVILLASVTAAAAAFAAVFGVVALPIAYWKKKQNAKKLAKLRDSMKTHTAT